MSPRERSAHAEFEQLAAGFALSALEPGDEQAFLAHLPGCERCAEALVAHSTTLGHLAFAAPAVDLPPSLLERIRAGIRADRLAGDGRGVARPLEDAAAPVSLDAARQKRAARTVRLSTALVGMAASLVLIVSLVFVGQRDSTGSDVEVTALDRAVQSLSAPGARSVRLVGAGQAVAVVNRGELSLVMKGLPVNDRSRSVYVLWSKSRKGGVAAVGTFDVPTQEVVVVQGLGRVDPDGLAALIVTQEQGRRAPQASKRPPVVSGEV